ncbi:MAG: DUF6431 domain-containing protein [Lachnospiraceae bacterium]|nr:DUF6431 domain-containing protein [Lachnospiraceae bacterium]
MYDLIRKENSECLYVKSKEKIPCPYCMGTFKVVGSRKRKIIRQDSSITNLIIRRLKCRKCQKISHELPDIVVPYKRYDVETIEKTLCHNTENEKKNIGCCPAETSTIYRWEQFFAVIVNCLIRIGSLFKYNSFRFINNIKIKQNNETSLAKLIKKAVNENIWIKSYVRLNK